MNSLQVDKFENLTMFLFFYLIQYSPSNGFSPFGSFFVFKNFEVLEATFLRITFFAVILINRFYSLLQKEYLYVKF